MHQRWAGIGLLALGLGVLSLLPLFVAVFPHYGISREATPETVLSAVASRRWLFVVPGAIEVAAHALGAVGMIALLLARDRSSLLLVVATFFGLLWMSADIIDNALTMTLVPQLATAFVSGDTAAPPALHAVMHLTDAVRLGAHFAGGLWLAGASLHLRRAGARGLGAAGIVIGAVLSANLFVPPLMFVSILTMPAFLVVLAFVLLRRTGPLALA